MCWRAAIAAPPHVEAASPSVLVVPYHKGLVSSRVDHFHEFP